MKKLLLAVLCSFLLTNLFAQKIEVSLNADGGLYHYGGSSAVASSVMVQGGSPQQDHTYNPYGNKNGFSYGGDVKAQLVYKGGFILGLQTGYEVLKSKVDIDYFVSNSFVLSDYAIAGIPTHGNASLINRNINLNPYFGYRFTIKKVSLDLMPGADIGFNLSTYDKGKATDNDNTTHTTNYKVSNTPTDVRLRFGIAAMYNKWGVTASCAHGLTNFDAGKNSGSPFKAHSELLRFGIAYRIY